MGSTVQPPVWRRILLLASTFMVVGSGAALVLYSYAVSTVSNSARDRLLDTAHIAAVQVDVEQHSQLVNPDDVNTDTYQNLVSNLIKIVGSVSDVKRLYTVRRTDDGPVAVLNASWTTPSTETNLTFLSQVNTLPPISGKAWSDAVTVTDEKPVKANGETVFHAYVPLIADDRTVESLLIVVSDYSYVEQSLMQLKSGLGIGLGIVLVVSILFAWALTKLSAVQQMKSPGGISFHKDRRLWITATLLLASAALLSDGAISYYYLETAGVEARQASRALQASRELQNELESEPAQGWAVRLDALEDFYQESGQEWIASLIKEYRVGLAEDSPSTSALKSKLIQAAQLDVARVQGDLGEAGGRIQVENSQQTVRLAVSVILGLVAIVLVGAVSRQERRLKTAIDESTLIQKEYQNLIGNIPIGVFAYSNGEVLFSGGDWGTRTIDTQSHILDTIHEEDRANFEGALKQAETDLRSFSATIRVADESETTHYEAYCAPVTTEDGRLRHLLIFCVDMTSLFSAKDEVDTKHGELEDKNRQLIAALKQVEHSLHTTVETMIRAVEVKDPYTAGHSERVRQYSVWIGEHLSLSDYEIKILSHGARIHDVGKIGIPDEILTKPAGLTAEESEIIQQHTVVGAKIVGNIEIFKDCVPIVRWHHERLDGTGYPDGLKGDELPFLVRIVAVADMFDAMTSNRSYRKGMETEDVMEIIARDASDGKIDQIVFNALVAVVEEHGTISQLDHGQTSRAA